MKQIPYEDVLQAEESGVLGLTWNIHNDTLKIANHYKINVPFANTKRGALSVVSRNFDPMGLFCPCVIPGKLFLQKLWTLKEFGWDTPFTGELQAEWDKLEVDLRKVPGHGFKRFVGIEGSENCVYDLATFTDASTKAFGLAVYLRVTDGTTVKVSLIFGKARLAPLKEVTLPWMELAALSIGARFTKFVEKELDLPIRTKTLFSDSNFPILGQVSSPSPYVQLQ